MSEPNPSDDAVIQATVAWLERAVIGLNLCPFAKSVHLKQQIRYVVSHARTEEALRQELVDELQFLQASAPGKVETTLLIHPEVLMDFLDYNQFLGVAEAEVTERGLDGVFQIASFHPAYQFAGTEPDDIENYTNRSPFPMLHLLREASIEAAIASYPNPAQIYERNVETLRRLGHEGWRRLLAE